MPFEVVPALEVNYTGNRKISCSVNIPRYLTERFGLAGFTKRMRREGRSGF